MICGVYRHNPYAPVVLPPQDPQMITKQCERNYGEARRCFLKLEAANQGITSEMISEYAEILLHYLGLFPEKHDLILLDAKMIHRAANKNHIPLQNLKTLQNLIATLNRDLCEPVSTHHRRRR
jgi:hypothetical protein